MTNFKFSMPIQPRYGDFDMLGHLNNATYLTYFEVARLNYFIEIGWDLLDVSNVVAHFDIEFLKPILPKTEVICSIKTTSLGNKSFKMEYELASPGKELLYSNGHSVQVCFDKKTAKPITIPQNIRKLIATYDNL